MDSQLRAWKALFGADDIGQVHAKALAGDLRDSTLRGVCWRMFLGYFPTGKKPSEWAHTLDEVRAEYGRDKEQYLVDPHKHVEMDVAVNNPLSTAEDSPWQKFFEQSELEKEIDKDVSRLFPEYDFFQQQEVLDICRRILLVWARKHEEFGYRQGMHELLAPIVYVLKTEAEAMSPDGVDDADKDTAAFLCDVLSPDNVECDAFAMFTRFMHTMKEFFRKGPKPRRKTEKEKLLESAEHTKLERSHADDLHVEESPVLARCRRIHEALRIVDTPLHKHITSLGLEPQLFMLKWVRLLFVREFHLVDVLLIWDGIFADDNTHGSELALLDYVALAMLTYVRQSVMERDYGAALMRLMKYPPVEDTHLMIERAIALRARKNAPRKTRQQIAQERLAKQRALAAAQQEQRRLAHQQRQQAQQQRQQHTTTTTTTSQPNSSTAPRAHPQHPAQLGTAGGVSYQQLARQYQHQLHQLHAAVVHKLGNALPILEDATLRAERSSVDFDEDKVELAIADLKALLHVCSRQLSDKGVVVNRSPQQQKQQKQQPPHRP